MYQQHREERWFSTVFLKWDFYNVFRLIGHDTFTLSTLYTTVCASSTWSLTKTSPNVQVRFGQYSCSWNMPPPNSSWGKYQQTMIITPYSSHPSPSWNSLTPWRHCSRTQDHHKDKPVNKSHNCSQGQHWILLPWQQTCHCPSIHSHCHFTSCRCEANQVGSLTWWKYRLAEKSHFSVCSIWL